MNRHSQLKVLQDFTCTGDKCPDNCCHSWRADVDERIHDKWQKLEDDNIARQLLESFEINEHSRQLKQKQNGECIHQLADGLCWIQSTLGHEYLPEICRNYPREQVGTVEHCTNSAYLSCPEIASLVINQPPAENAFERFSIQDKESSLLSWLDWLLSTVLANRVVPLNIKLYCLAQYLVEINAALQSNKNIASKLNHYLGQDENFINKKLITLLNKVDNNKIKHHKVFEGFFWKMVCDTGDSPGQILDGSLVDKKARHKEDEWIAVFDSIQLIRNTEASRLPAFYLPAMDKLLEVNLVNRGFPYAMGRDTVIQVFMDAIISIAQVSLFSWIAIKNNALNSVDEMSLLIARVERNLVHNNKLLDYFEKHQESQQLEKFIAALLWLPA